MGTYRLAIRTYRISIGTDRLGTGAYRLGISTYLLGKDIAFSSDAQRPQQIYKRLQKENTILDAITCVVDRALQC